MHKLIKAVTVAALSFTAATAVHAQRPPESWVLVVTSQGGDRTYFDAGAK